MHFLPQQLNGKLFVVIGASAADRAVGERLLLVLLHGILQLQTGKDGMMQFGKKMQAAPGTGDYLKLRREWIGLPYRLPFTAFYVNEKRAKAVESALNKRGSGILTFRVWKGFAVPVSLEIGGVSVKEIR